MANTDYGIEALKILLDRDCLTERYYPLIKYKDSLMSLYLKSECRTKSDAEKLCDGKYYEIGLDSEEICLLHRFFGLYDPAPQKFKEIIKLAADENERSAFYELYMLPGVRYVRAKLYYDSGYKTLSDIACTTAEKIVKNTAKTVQNRKTPCAVPFLKEAATHVAVAKAFVSC